MLFWWLLPNTLVAASWHSEGVRDNVALYSQDVPGSDVVALRGVGPIEAPLWKVAAILLDPERSPEWVDSLAAARVLQRVSPLSYLEYNHVAMPFILADRDLVSLVTLDISPKEKKFALHYRPAEFPLPPNRHVRGKVLSAQMRLTQSAKATTVLDAELHCDPMGSLPKWLVNFFQSGWAHETFLGLRRQAAKTDIRVPADFASVLAPTLKY